MEGLLNGFFIGMTLKAQLKKLIVEDLNLTDFHPEDIGDDDPLFGDRFGLDSIDAVELVFQLKAQFGVEIKNMKEGRSVLRSINSISAFIEKRRGA
jgi:acyl carrier protein